tara:strand:+ start:172 stop:552 length:381 start_codon:yes stop_codon:yes gene_type:complete
MLQSTLKFPELIQLNKVILVVWVGPKYSKKTNHERIAEIKSRRVVTICEYLSPKILPKKEQKRKPTNGKNTIKKINFYPFNLLICSTEIDPRFLKKTTRIAKPMAASAAAIVNVNIANICPAISPE